MPRNRGGISAPVPAGGPASGASQDATGRLSRADPAGHPCGLDASREPRPDGEPPGSRFKPRFTADKSIRCNGLRDDREPRGPFRPSPPLPSATGSGSMIGLMVAGTGGLADRGPFSGGRPRDAGGRAAPDRRGGAAFTGSRLGHKRLRDGVERGEPRRRKETAKGPRSTGLGAGSIGVPIQGGREGRLPPPPRRSIGEPEGRKRRFAMNDVTAACLLSGRNEAGVTDAETLQPLSKRGSGRPQK